MTDHELAMLQAINAARLERGLHALAANANAAAAARRHAEDMAYHPGLVHIGSDGSDGGARLLQEGYYWAAWTEAVGWGFGGDVGAMVMWWLASAEHRAIVLSADMVDIGVGYATGLGPWGSYWCVDFGRRRDGTPPPPEPPPPPPARPYTSYAPVVVGGTVAAGVDLLDYLRGDGRAYRVGNPVSYTHLRAHETPEHRGIILSADMVDIGVGYATGLGPWGSYWCVDLARRRGGRPTPPPSVFVPVVVG